MTTLRCECGDSECPSCGTAQGTKSMDDYTAVGIAEGFIECDDTDQIRAAWQHLVNTGLAWRLQGFFGRTARALIEAGEIHE